MDVLNGRPGPWVLWSEVIDPADCGPESRVYALNDETGDITFGDGVHGKIPPPGRDTIAAERYRRGGGAAANAVGAWSQVNLISPVPGVERLVVPEGAAGGSDAQDAASVVRFAPANLFTRGRALTMRDLEILALQSSPDIAQVRAIGAGPSVRLVVAMRGADPTPPFAVRRELVRYLSGLASPMLLGADAETSMVRAPRCIPIRLTLDLLIAGIEQSGLVAREAATRIATLLDQAQGGFDRAGWRLGDRVTPEDLSAALDGIPGLESISRIEIDVQGVDGTWGPMPDRLRPGDLLRSSPAELRIAFETADTGAGR
jgi:predicted phage baseplate assembly protein